LLPRDPVQSIEARSQVNRFHRQVDLRPGRNHRTPSRSTASAVRSSSWSQPAPTDSSAPATTIRRLTDDGGGCGGAELRTTFASVIGGLSVRSFASGVAVLRLCPLRPSRSRRRNSERHQIIDVGCSPYWAQYAPTSPPLSLHLAMCSRHSCAFGMRTSCPIAHDYFKNGARAGGCAGCRCSVGRVDEHLGGRQSDRWWPLHEALRVSGVGGV